MHITMNKWMNRKKQFLETSGSCFLNYLHVYIIQSLGRRKERQKLFWEKRLDLKSPCFLLVCFLFGLRSLVCLAAERAGFRRRGGSSAHPNCPEAWCREPPSRSGTEEIWHPSTSPTTIRYHWNNGPRT